MSLKFKESRAFKIFGKRKKDLTPQELMVYNTESQKIRRNKFEKKDIRETAPSHKEGAAFKFLGKRHKDFTTEELKKYNIFCKYGRKNPSYEESIAFKIFGKRWRDLSSDELRVYGSELKKRRR